MSRTTPVQLAVQIERIERGGVLALAHVEISIAGVPITLQGLKVRRGLDGVMTIELPMFDHPSGARFPCIELHDDLALGVVGEVIAAWARISTE
jgi:hypothetical protein